MPISRPDPLWADLLNSDWHDYRGSGAREDRISNDTWMASFLARAGWEGGLPAPAEREFLRSLRSRLRRVVDALIAGKGLSSGDLKALNDFLASSPLVPRLEKRGSGWRLSQAPSAAGIGRVAAAVALSFASMLADGDPARIKICANPDCGWVIYDESHNRTRRWCDVKECGNLIKVRRFRARSRSGS
jgi:predicted RNA-binding Zn ribbon-like protein